MRKCCFDISSHSDMYRKKKEDYHVDQRKTQEYFSQYDQVYITILFLQNNRSKKKPYFMM
jgi:hypothetical protein